MVKQEPSRSFLSADSAAGSGMQALILSVIPHQNGAEILVAVGEIFERMLEQGLDSGFRPAPGRD